MQKTFVLLLLLTSLMFCSCGSKHQSADSADSADALQTWHNDHFGMFIHFGVYSKLGGIWKGEQIPFYGEQIMNHARIPIAEYEAVAREFNPVDFNADSIVALAKDAGMKYIVITTKHHDGFCMFDTKTTDYDIVDFTPYGKDVVGLLAEACRRQGMKLGFYYSLPDWHFPKGIPRMAPDPATKCWEHVNQVYSPLEIVTPELEDYIVAQITELLSNYGEITTIWFDMGLITPEQSRRFRDTVKKLQPNCLINGRIMNNMGDYMTLPDNGNVAAYANTYWDNPASLYGTWGYKSWIQRPPLEEQIQRQIGRLTSTVSHGGVFLLNIGPDGNGRVIDYEKQVLHGIGDFLRAHPDTLDALSHQSKLPAQYPAVDTKGDTIILTEANGLYHPALDGKGYMSVEPHSSLAWEVSFDEKADYVAFIVYEPEYNDQEYQLHYSAEQAPISRVLPGVDRMVQTAYLGTLTLGGNRNIIRLSLSDKTTAAESLKPLGLISPKIILIKK